MEFMGTYQPGATFINCVSKLIYSLHKFRAVIFGSPNIKRDINERAGGRDISPSFQKFN